MNADELLDGYVAWREECQVVRLAFEWVGPPVAGAIAEWRAPRMSPL